MYEGKGNPRVRILHSSPDAPAVDIYVDDSPAITGLSFGQISDFATLPSGRHNVKVYPASASGKGQPVIEANVDLMAGQDYTVVAIGKLQDIQPMVLVDTTMAPKGDMAKVRIIHASPDAPSVDIAVPGGPVLFRDVKFKQTTSWMDVKSGSYTLEVRPAGSTQAVMTVPNFRIEGGNLYTFVALGMLKGTPSFMILPVVDTVAMKMPA
ncbi:MAG: DUF4397 domain-containing protein [Anaerolineae bacterium]